MHPADTSVTKLMLRDVRSLMLAVASALAMVSATPPKGRLPPALAELRKALGRPDYLGPDGLAVLFLRKVDSGEEWHEAANLRERALSDPLPAPIRPVDHSLLPAPDKLDLAHRERVAALEAWWQERRQGGVAGAQCRGVIVQEGDAYWVKRDGNYVAAGQTLLERKRQIRHHRKQPAEGPGRTRMDVVAAWAAFRDDEQGRLCIDVDAEEGGLCLGALLLEVDPDCKRGCQELFDAVIVSTWEVARIAVQQYWIFWDRVHSRKLIHAISLGADANDHGHAAREYDELFDRVAGGVDRLLDCLSRAFQSPTSALLVPDTHGAINLVSHVGYLEPGKPVSLADGDKGLSHLFCLQRFPINHAKKPAALQFVDAAAHVKAHEDFGVGEAAGQRSEADRILRELISAPAHCPRVHEGPFTYAHVPLHARFWPERLPYSAASTAIERYHLKDDAKRWPSGVIKLQGRIRCALDRASGPPPKLAHVELRRLHEWSSTVALVLDRLLHVNEQSVVQSITRDVVPLLAARDLAPFATRLARRLRAASIALCRKSGDAFEPIAHKMWDGAADKAAWVVEALRGPHLLNAAGNPLEPREGEIVRGFVLLGPPPAARMNCAWVPVDDAHALAVAGVPPELSARRHASSTPTSDPAWLEERSRPFPRLYDATLQSLGDLLRVRMSVAPPHGGRESGPDATPEAKKGLFGTLVASCRGDETSASAQAIKEGLGAWLGRARATWGRSECIKWLGIAPRTLERAAEELGTSWTQILPGKTFTSEAEAFEELARIQDGARRRDVP